MAVERAAIIAPIFAQIILDKPNWGPTKFTIKEATVTLIAKPPKVTRKNLENSLPNPCISFLSKAHSLSPKYLLEVAKIKENPLKREKNGPAAIPEIQMKIFNIPKSIKAPKVPINRNLAPWKIKINLLPIKKAIYKQTTLKIGKITGKTQTALILNNQTKYQAVSSPIIRAIMKSAFFIFLAL